MGDSESPKEGYDKMAEKRGQHTNDDNNLLLKVEIENYQALHSSRMVSLIVDPHKSVLETLLLVAQKPNVSLNVDEALHDYFLFIPKRQTNTIGTEEPKEGRAHDRKSGTVLKNDKTLADYGLKHKDKIVLMKKRPSKWKSMMSSFSSRSNLNLLAREDSISRDLPPQPLSHPEYKNRSSISFQEGGQPLSSSNERAPEQEREEPPTLLWTTSKRRMSIASSGEEKPAFTDGPKERRNTITQKEPTLLHKFKSRASFFQDEERTVFEVPLSASVERSSIFGIPTVVHKAIEYLEKRLDIPGLFQRPGLEREVKAFRRAFDLGEDIQFEETNPLVVADLLKLYLNLLPEPLLSYGLYDPLFADFCNEPKHGDTESIPTFVTNAKFFVSKLPVENQALLAKLMAFLKNVHDHAHNNGLVLPILSILFGPVLLRKPEKADVEAIRVIVREFLKHHDYLFVSPLPRDPECIAGEVIVHKLDKVFGHIGPTDTSQYNEQSIDLHGIMWLSNYKIVWTQMYTNVQEEPFTVQIPLGSIASVKRLGKGKNKNLIAGFLVVGKDFRSYAFAFKDSVNAIKTAYTYLQNSLYQTPIQDQFPFCYKENIKTQALPKTIKYDPNSEMKRFRVSLMEWKCANVNPNYSITSCYPQMLYMPTRVHADLVEKSGMVRKDGCFPVFAWGSTKNNAAIYRTGAPMLGSVVNVESYDQRLLEMYSRLNPTNSEKTVVLDTGSAKEWHATAYPGCEFHYLDMANVKLLKEAQASLERLSFPYHISPQVLSKPWLEEIRKIFKAATMIMDCIEQGESVVIQQGTNNLPQASNVSDDGESLFPLLSIAQILLDPYYRTLEGFQVLFQKDWVSFGYRFGARLGHARTSKQGDEYIAPYFELFIDAVWQLWIQFPSAFEFNTRFLEFILEESTKNMYGDFICNNCSERETYTVDLETVSLWTEVEGNVVYTNKFYNAKKYKYLHPTLDLPLWKDRYLKENQRTVIFQGRIEQLYNNVVQSGATHLELTDKRLAVLPWTLTEMKNLTSLDISGNEFNLIPTVLFLCNLTKLNMSHNHLAVLPKPLFSIFARSLTQLTDLNISGNQLTSIPPGLGKLTSLKILDLSDNHLDQLPASISNLVQLNYLLVRKNQLSVFPSINTLSSLEFLDLTSNLLSHTLDFHLPRLRVLRLGKNAIPEVPQMKLVSLQEIDFTRNKINTLPGPFCLQVCQSLKKLVLRGNNLTSLPAEISSLASLTELDLEGNLLQELPPQVLSLQNLQKLNISKNLLAQLPSDLDQLGALTHLQVAHNSLLELPTSIGKIEGLVYLDVADNKLDSLPPTIALLKKLSEFHFVNNKLSTIPKSIIQSGPRSTLEYLKDLLQGEQQLFRVRVMVVGEEKVGKTSLCACLRTQKLVNNLSTDGINIENWLLPILINGMKQDVDISLWDFAGQEIYYATHQFFMSRRVIYIVVWNLSKETESSKLEFWLHSIKARVKSAVVFLVGTHLDSPKMNPEAAAYILRKLESKFKASFPTLDFHARAVSCVTGDGIKKLRHDIEDAVLLQQHMGERLPTSFMLLEKRLLKESENRMPPIISKKELLQIATTCNIEDERTLMRATRTLHELGSLLHFEMDPKLNDLVLLSPKWLTDMMATVLTAKHNFAKDGILHHSSLPQIWRAPLHPPEIHRVLLSLLENFEIAFDLTPFDSKYTGATLIPSLLPEEVPTELEHHWAKQTDGTQTQFSRYYQFDFIPYGFFGRIIVRLLHLYNNNCSKSIYWQHGILIHSNTPKQQILVQLFDKTIAITARTNYVANIPRNVIQTLETLVRHWYKLSVQVFVPCVHCLEAGVSPTLFSLEECQVSAVTKKQYINCIQQDIITPVRLDLLVPDLTMKDVEGSRIAYEELVFEELLGEGSAATVHKGIWRGEAVAIKKLKVAEEPQNKFDEEDESFSKVFTEFRREVYIMSGLEHKNLVALKGVCLDPLCIVTEFMEFGDLFHLLKDTSKQLDWPLRLKIAVDVVNGMCFLHNANPPIIHRDLKSPNVLLASLSASSNVVAKIADFGLSGAIQTVSHSEVANPRWLAPEVMNNAEFAQPADVYSCGVILWELASRSEFFGDTQWNTVITERVLNGERPEIPEDCPREWAQLIQSCWAQDPAIRPTFTDIRVILGNFKHRIERQFPNVEINISAENIRKSSGNLSRIPEDDSLEN